MTYDPQENPRYLGPDPFEEQEAEERSALERQEVDFRLQVAHECKELFKKRGWRHVAATLQKHRDEDTRRLISGITENREEDMRLRGKIEALDLLLAFPDLAEREYDRFSDAIHEIQEGSAR